MKAETYPFVMRSLPYECYDLAPCISAETLFYHHDKIYKHYVDQLNLALADYPLLQGLSLWELLAWPENLPENLRIEVKRNGGGAFNHELYFDSLQPLKFEQDPKGALLEAMIHDFGSLREFREQMNEVAMKQFASGYGWLVMTGEGQLALRSTANQEVPDLKHEIPLLNVDVWEHSHYLQYQNRRRDYLTAWHRLINWRKVAWRYDEAAQRVREERMLRGETGEEAWPGSGQRGQSEDETRESAWPGSGQRGLSEDETRERAWPGSGQRGQSEDETRESAWKREESWPAETMQEKAEDGFGEWAWVEGMLLGEAVKEAVT